MKLVANMGEIFKMTDTGFEIFLNHVSVGKEVHFALTAAHAKSLGPFLSVTDMTAEDARNIIQRPRWRKSNAKTAN